jgi:hypothetical protein
MNRFKLFITLFFVFSFILLGADVDHQKFNRANINFKNQIKLHQNNDLQIPSWLISKANYSSHQFQKTNHKNNSRDVMDIKVNGDDQTTILQGEDIVITIYFSDNCFEAYVEMWADMNNNGTWEENTDLPIPDENEYITDNDPEDEDPTVGVYQITLSADDEGPNMVSNLGLLFLAEDTGGFDEAFVFIDPLTSDFSISGDVTPVAANLIVMAMNEDEDMFMTATSSSGDYQNYIAEAGIYFLMAFDPLGVLNGMFSLTNYDNVDINGHLTGYDFTFEPGNSTIEGTVTDEGENPLEGITVWVGDDGPTSVWGVTDSDGFYSVTIIEGYWEVGLNRADLIPDFMAPDEIEIYVDDGAVEVVDFMVYSTDDSITGTIYLDGIPASGFEVNAQSPGIGYSSIESSEDGTYNLPVSTAGNAMGGYYVNVDIWDYPGLYVDEYYDNIITGSSGIDFHIHTANGGLEGFMYDSVTMEPIDESWISASDGINYYNAGTDDDGSYTLYLPNGTYEVWGQGDMYYQEYLESVVIADEYVNIDFYLDPIIFEGNLSGMVFEQGTTNPIPFADLSVWDDDFWSYTTADENGFYYFDMPNGTFTLSSGHSLYYTSYVEDIEILSNAITVDIEMEPIIFNGALEGYVYEDNTTNPIPYANIEIQGEGIWFPTMSDDMGFYHFDLPNGFFNLDCWKEGYLGTYIGGIEIIDNTVDLDIYLIPDVEADPLLEPGINLLTNYPNPFNPSTTIRFSIENNKQYELYIYNLKGQKVRTLDVTLSPSTSLRTGLVEGSAVWNGTDESNKPVSSGIYFYNLNAGDLQQIRKMLLIK